MIFSSGFKENWPSPYRAWMVTTEKEKKGNEGYSRRNKGSIAIMKSKSEDENQRRGFRVLILRRTGIR